MHRNFIHKNIFPVFIVVEYYFWFQVPVAYSLLMAVLHSREKLLEEERGSLLSRAAVDFDAIEKFSTVGQLHQKKDGALALLG